MLFQGYILGNNGVYYPLPFDYIISYTISGTVFGGIAQHISLWQAGNNFKMEAFLIPGDSINTFSNAHYSIVVYYTKTTD